MVRKDDDDPEPPVPRCALRSRLLRRVPAGGDARSRPRPDVGGGLHRHPGRRVGVVHLGAAERGVRPRVAAAGPRWSARARHRGHPRHPDLRHPAVAADAAPGDRRDRRRRPRDRLGSPAGDGPVVDRLPLVRRAHHPEGRLPLRRPPGRDRLPGRQRAREQPPAQRVDLPGVRRLAAEALRHRRASERGVGPGLLVAPDRRVVGTVAAGRQPHAAVRTGVAAVPGRAGHRPHRLAGRHRARVRQGRPVRHDLHLVLAPADLGRRDGRLPRHHRGQPLLPDAGRPFGRHRPPAPGAVVAHRSVGAVPVGRPAAPGRTSRPSPGRSSSPPMRSSAAAPG